MSITVSVDNLGPCRKLLRVEVPADAVNGAFEEITAAFQRQVELPGFRPGKVPRHLVVRNFGGRINDETKKKLLDDSFREAAKQQNLRVIATISTEELSFGRGLPFSYTVTLEHAPEFELPNYKGLKAGRPVRAVTDEDVNRAINILREQRVEYKDVSRPLQAGDVAVVNYTGTCEGKPITEWNPTAKGLTAKENFWLLIDPNAFIPGFGPALEGAAAGEHRTVALTFPADFVIKEVAGKAGSYEVDVVGVKEKILPEAGEDFAKTLGAGSFDELLAGVRRDLQNELEFNTRRNVRDQLLRGLLDQVQFELPESVVTSETRSLVYNIVNENQRRGVAPEVIETRKDEIFAGANSSAKDRVKAAFILNRIAEAEKIQVSRDEMIRRVEAMARQNNVPADKMAKTLQERNALGEVQQDILTGKVLDFIEVNAVIEDVAAPVPQA
jgi:trigger factor